MRRTSVWPPRAVGFETSTSRQWYGAFSYSKYIFRLMSIASIRLAIASSLFDRAASPRPPPPKATARQTMPRSRCSGLPGSRHARGRSRLVRRRETNLDGASGIVDHDPELVCAQLQHVHFVQSPSSIIVRPPASCFHLPREGVPCGDEMRSVPSDRNTYNTPVSEPDEEDSTRQTLLTKLAGGGVAAACVGCWDPPEQDATATTSAETKNPRCATEVPAVMWTSVSRGEPRVGSWRSAVTPQRKGSDIVVNNLGIFEPKPFEEIPDGINLSRVGNP